MRKFVEVVVDCSLMYWKKSISRTCKPSLKIPSPVPAMPYPGGNGFKNEPVTIPKIKNCSFKCFKQNGDCSLLLILAMKRQPRHSMPAFDRFTAAPTVALPVNARNHRSARWQPCCSSAATRNCSYHLPLPTTAIGSTCCKTDLPFNKLWSKVQAITHYDCCLVTGLLNPRAREPSTTSYDFHCSTIFRPG